jgi:hypothetical protein
VSSLSFLCISSEFMVVAKILKLLYVIRRIVL